MYEYSYVCTLARITCDEKEHVMYGMPFQKYTMVRSTSYHTYTYHGCVNMNRSATLIVDVITQATVCVYLEVFVQPKTPRASGLLVHPKAYI